MSLKAESLAARFRIDVGKDADTGLEVASVVRDDEQHINLNVVEALLIVAETHPAAFNSLINLLFDLVDESDGEQA